MLMINNVVARITGTHFKMCAGQQFFRGTVNTCDGGTACIFASTS